MSVSKQHTPGPYIVRGEIDAGLPGYAMGAEPASDDGAASQDCGWPYFIREDREFPLGSGPLWLAHGIQRKADADLFAAAPDMLKALGTCLGLITKHGLNVELARSHPEDYQRLETARAAIAKAEGRA